MSASLSRPLISSLDVSLCLYVGLSTHILNNTYTWTHMPWALCSTLVILVINTNADTDMVLADTDMIETDTDISVSAKNIGQPIYRSISNGRIIWPYSLQITMWFISENDNWNNII